MKPRRVAAATAVALAVSACSTTATIQRFDGPDVEATIEDSDARGLYVRASNGRIYRLDRNQVGDIDHPGNVALTVGAALVGMLAITVAGTSKDSSRSETAVVGQLSAANDGEPDGGTD
jgi:hypothetical protein